MPNGNVTSKYWFVRVTLPHLSMKLHAKQWEENLMLADHIRMLMVGHTGVRSKKEHSHFIVELYEPRQKQSIDKRYKTLFGVRGTDYSSKAWDGNMGTGAGSYLFHDPGAEIQFNRGFTDEQIQEFRDCADKVREVVMANKDRASGRCVNRILEKITDSGETWTRTQIAEEILDQIHDGAMYEPGDYVIKRYIEEIYMKQLDDTRYSQYRSLRVAYLLRSNEMEQTGPI